MILQVNPATDEYTSMQKEILKQKLFSELSVYKYKAPTVAELKTLENRLYKVFKDSLYKIGQKSYLDGCKEVSIQPASNYLIVLDTTVKDRSQFAAHSITHTAAMAFGELYAALGKKQVTGKKHSKGISNYEGNRIFFEQRTKAWRLKAGLQKSWYPSSDNVCPLCEDNEDEGPIPVDQAFPSGDLFAPAHFGCLCYIGITL